MASFGVVKWFNSKKGYGFIESDSGEDFFVHISYVCLDKSRTFEGLLSGQRVSFDPDRSPKGRIAINVMTI